MVINLSKTMIPSMAHNVPENYAEQGINWSLTPPELTEVARIKRVHQESQAQIKVGAHGQN